MFKLTFGDHSFQVNDIRMVKLANHAGLAQEVQPLLLGKPRLQGLDGHTDLSLSRKLQTTAAHLAKLT